MGDCTTQFHMRNIIYIMINRCKDPNWTTTRMESIRGFFCGSIDLRTYIGSRTFQLAMSWFSVIFFLISGSSWVEQVQGVFSWTLLDAERPGFHGHVLALPCFTPFFFGWKKSMFDKTSWVSLGCSNTSVSIMSPRSLEDLEGQGWTRVAFRAVTYHLQVTKNAPRPVSRA